MSHYYDMAIHENSKNGIKIYRYTFQKESKVDFFEKKFNITSHNFNRKQEISKSC